MFGIEDRQWRKFFIGVAVVLAMWFIAIQWLHGYTLRVLSAESNLRIDCEEFLYESADMREVKSFFERRGYDVVVENSELSADRLVPFNGPLYGTSVVVGVIMSFEDGKAARFRIYKSGGAL
jgi:hypothetical protein